MSTENHANNPVNNEENNEENVETPSSQSQETQQQQSQVMEDVGGDTEKDNESKLDLLKVDIKDDNTALNVIVGFLGIAQRRGTFAINESAKIYECIQQFQKD